MTAPETTTQQTTAEVAAPNPGVRMVKQTFHFKTEKLVNEKGEKIGEGKKHPSVELPLPVPTNESLRAILDKPESKEYELLLDAVTAIIYGAARSQINDFRETNRDGTVTPAIIDLSKLEWSVIANMPKAQRGTSVPSDEDQKAFFAQYLAVMPAATSKSADKIENHIRAFGQLRKLRDRKDVLEALQNSLAVFTVTVTADVLEEQMEVVDYLNGRIDRLLKAEDTITMDSI